MKTKCIFILLFILGFNLCLKAAVNKESEMIENNISYKLNISIPNDYDENLAYPLVVAMHYCGGTAVQYRNGLSGLCDSLKMIIVCPDNNSQVIPEKQLNMLVTAIDSTRHLYNIDTTQVYLTGMSCNGEFITRHGLNNFYPFKGIFPWVPWITTTNPKYNFDSKMPIVMGVGSIDQNYTQLMATYDSLKAHDANVNLLLVPNIGHTMEFADFSNKMIECIYYLNGTPDFSINPVEDFSLLNSDSLMLDISVDNPQNKELSYSASYNNINLISQMKIITNENTNEFQLKLVPNKTKKGKIIITLKAYDKTNGLLTQEIVYIDLQEDKTDSNQLNKSDFILYPNPANDYIYFTGEEKDITVEIMDINGKVLQKQNKINSKNGIQIKLLPKGNYVLNATGIDDIKTFKFSKL